MSDRSGRRQGRPPAFSYLAQKSGLLFRRSVAPQLCCEQIPLSQLAERFGTPLYVYSASAIREHVRAFQRAFVTVPNTICYAVKANSNLSILRLLAKMGCGFDVVSGGELERVQHVIKTPSSSVVFSGVGKTQQEIEDALKAGVLLFNVESDSELRSLSECTTRLKKTARISIRVNPNVAAETHPYVSTGTHQHKFGVPITRARWLYAQAASVKRLTVAGVSVHIGSQITESKPFAISMERVAELIKDLRADGHKIEFVDAGGGLGIDYRGASSTDFAALVADYADAILRPLRGLKVHVLLEPGRAIVGPAGILLTKAIYKKTNGNKSFVVVDAAMNDLIRPALYQAYHEIIPVTYGGRPQETVDVVGPVCETGDFFAHDRELPETSEGDLLAILDAGAYGMVQASNYNTRPRPAEVLVDGKTAKVVRRRETVADLIKHET